MGKQPKELFHHLKEHYSLAEAKEVIDRMLEPYGETCRITFRNSDAEIIDSYLVDDIDVRRTVCEIIARTGITKRSYEDLSAEWRVHNVSYRAGIKRSSAKDVSLDYAGDPRKSVRAASKLFDKLDLE